MRDAIIPFANGGKGHGTPLTRNKTFGKKETELYIADNSEFRAKVKTPVKSVMRRQRRPEFSASDQQTIVS